MEKIFQGVKQFYDSVFPSQRDMFQRLAREQRPRALFITCSDSRVHPNLITQTDPGELFIMRNPGNIVPPYRSGEDSEAATIEYAIEVLRVVDIIVCGHSNCGAMSALFKQDGLEDMPAVRGWLRRAESTRRVVEAIGEDLSTEERLERAIERNVTVQLDNLRTHPSVAAGLERGDVNLHAWVYHIGNGEVYAYDDARRKFVSLVEAPLEILAAV